MSEPTNIPNIRGPTPSQDSSKGTPVDPEKFKRLLKVDESDEAQKRGKRNLKKQEEEEEETEEAQATPKAGLFGDLLKGPKHTESIYDVQEPLSLPQNLKSSAPTMTSQMAAPSTFQQQNLQSQVESASSQESGDFHFIPSQSRQPLAPAQTPPTEEGPRYTGPNLKPVEIPPIKTPTSSQKSSSKHSLEEKKEAHEAAKKSEEKKKEDEKKLKNAQLHAKKPVLHQEKKTEIEKEKLKKLEQDKTVLPSSLTEKKEVKSQLKELKLHEIDQLKPFIIGEEENPSLTEQALPMGLEKKAEEKEKVELTKKQPPISPSITPATQEELSPEIAKLKKEKELKEKEKQLLEEPTSIDLPQGLTPLQEKEPAFLQKGSKEEAIDGIKGKEGSKELEPSSIQSVSITPYLEMIQPPAPIEPTPYSRLSPEVFDIFQRMVGLMTIEKESGVSTTTIEIHNPNSMFNSGKLVLQHYDTAPHAFNVEFQGNESQVNLFNDNITDLLAAIQHAKLTYVVNIKRAILAPTYRVEKKEGASKETKK
jgi:hypothetical protein